MQAAAGNKCVRQINVLELSSVEDEFIIATDC